MFLYKLSLFILTVVGKVWQPTMRLCLCFPFYASMIAAACIVMNYYALLCVSVDQWAIDIIIIIIIIM